MLIVLLAAFSPLLALIAVVAWLRAASLGRERAALFQQIRRARAQKQWAEEDALAVLAEATQLEDALALSNARLARLQRQLQRLKSKCPPKPVLRRCGPLPFKIGHLPNSTAITRNAHLN